MRVVNKEKNATPDKVVPAQKSLSILQRIEVNFFKTRMFLYRYPVVFVFGGTVLCFFTVNLYLFDKPRRHLMQIEKERRENYLQEISKKKQYPDFVEPEQIPRVLEAHVTEQFTDTIQKFRERLILYPSASLAKDCMYFSSELARGHLQEETHTN